MPSLNKVILVGRLTKDPELRYTGSGLALCKFAVAVDRRFKNSQTGERQTDFFDCTAFRQTAEYVNSYLTKGRMVAVEGSIELNDAVGQDGQKRRYVNIVCDQVQGLDRADGDAPQGGAGGMGGDAPMDRPGQAPQAQDDNGYYPEEEAAPAPAARRAAPAARQDAPPRAAAEREAPEARQAPARGASGNGGAPAARGAAPARGAAGGNRPAPQAAYPEDDFDDSDPFADE